MHWYIINPRDGELEADCPDDDKGEANVLDYLTNGLERFNEQGIRARDMIVIRGERKLLVPPADKHVLVPFKD